MITILRRYYTCNFLNPSTFEVELKLTVRITGKPRYILLPSGSYRGDLKVTDSKGYELVIMSDRGYEQLEGFSMKQINEAYVQKISSTLSEKQKHELLKNHRVIAIMLPKDEDDYYEIITMKWITDMKNKISLGSYQHIEIPLYFHRYGVLDTKLSSIYLSIKTSDKYRIMNNLIFTDLLTKTNCETAVILNESNHKIYRLEATSTSQLIQTIVKIALPIAKESWARIGFISATLIPIFIIAVTVINGKPPPHSYETLAALIAFIIGQKVFLFQDLHLMEHWNTSLMGSALWCLLVIFVLMIFFPSSF